MRRRGSGGPLLPHEQILVERCIAHPLSRYILTARQNPKAPKSFTITPKLTARVTLSTFGCLATSTSLRPPPDQLEMPRRSLFVEGAKSANGVCSKRVVGEELTIDSGMTGALYGCPPSRQSADLTSEGQSIRPVER